MQTQKESKSCGNCLYCFGDRKSKAVRVRCAYWIPQKEVRLDDTACEHYIFYDEPNQTGLGIHPLEIVPLRASHEVVFSGGLKKYMKGGINNGKERRIKNY